MREPSLFDDAPASDTRVEIPLAGAELTYYEFAFSRREADAHYDALLQSTPWRHDRDCALEYSGIRVPALPFTDVLTSIRERVVALTGVTFNGVLVTCYRDGNDSVGWHSDDEPEWGPNPVIGSVSFGATRDFVLKPVAEQSLKPVTVSLTHGSLLLMGPTVQNAWQHQLPKRKRCADTRINLTFRNLLRARGDDRAHGRA